MFLKIPFVPGILHPRHGNLQGATAGMQPRKFARQDIYRTPITRVNREGLEWLGIEYGPDSIVSHWSQLPFDRNHRTPRGSREDFRRGVEVEGGHVLHLLFGDLAALGHGDLADLVLVWLTAALFGLDRFLEQHAGWWALDFEVEGAVLVDRHEN